MAASQEQKVDYLLKKIGYVASKTGIAEDSTLSGTKKAPFAESIPSPLVIPSNIVWADSSFITTTPPSSDTDYVGVYTSGNAFRMTFDNTIAGNRSFIARSSYGNQSSSIQGDWIDTSFGSDYIINVYKGDPSSSGVKLSAAGSGSNDTWFFDYSSGVLNFNGTAVPTGIATDNVYLVGYRYTGAKGIKPPAGIATFNDLNVSGITTLGTVQISSGIVTATSGVVTYYGDGSKLTGITTVNDATLTLATSGDGISGSDTFTANQASDTTFTVTVSSASTNQANTLVYRDSSGGFSAGVVTATSFSGSGSGLTGITTNFVSAIGIQSAGVAIGVGITQLNFIGAGNTFKVDGTTIDVSIQGGGGGSVWESTSAGINTTSNVGVGTTNPTSKLHVVGDTLVTGVSTFNNDVNFPSSFNDANLKWDESSAYLKVEDQGRFVVGDGFDLQIYSRPSSSSLPDHGYGKGVYIYGQNEDITLRIGSGDTFRVIGNAGATFFTINDLSEDVRLYQSGSEKFRTLGAGVTVFGNFETQTLNVSGVSTFTGDVSFGSTATFGDDDKLKFGDSVELEIYSNGSSSFIKESGSGNLKVLGNSILIKDTADSEFYAKFNQNSSVELYYDNSKKFETTNTGAIVTGVLTATTFSGSGASLASIPNSALDNSTVSYGGISLALGASDATPAFNLSDATSYPYTSLTGVTTNIIGDTTPQLGGNLDLNSKNITGIGTIDVTGDLLLTSTDAGTTAYPFLDLYRNSASPDVSDNLGRIRFNGENDANQKIIYSYIGGKLQDNADGEEDGRLDFYVMSAGSLSGRITLQGNGSTLFKNKNVLLGQSVNLLFEGASDNTNETTLTVTDPTQDNTITLPDSTGTVLLNVVEDTTPQLGGNLDANSKDISGVNNLNVSGVSTFTGDVSFGSTVTFGDNDQILMGDGDDLKIYHSGTNSIISDNGNGALDLRTNGGSVRIRTTGLEEIAQFNKNGSVDLYYDNSLKFQTTGIGVSVANGAGNTAYIEGPSEIWIDPHPAGVGATSGAVRIRGDLYVDGTEFIVDVDKIELGDFNVGIASTVGTNALLDGAGIGIGSTNIRKTITWNNATSALMSSENWNLASGKHYEINGTDVLTSTTLGSGVVNSSLTSVGTLGSLTVTNDITANGNIVGDNSTNISGISSVTATTFHGSGANLTNVDAATLDGVDSTSFLRSDAADIKTSGNLTFNDSIQARFGTSGDMSISHDGTDNHITSSYDKDLNIEVSPDGGTPKLYLRPTTSHQGITLGGGNGNPVELYHTNVKKFETTGAGVTITGEADVNGNLNVSGVSTFTGDVSFGSTATFGDDDRLRFGAGNDLQIYHDGSDSYILEDGTGLLNIDTSFVRFRNSIGNKSVATFTHTTGITGGVTLYWDGDSKFQTTGIGVTVYGTTETQQLNVSGVVTATTCSGSGSSLTGLTGASAATYGSATVAPVITVDANGRITTISTATISGGGSSVWESTSAGINTTSNVGIGTTNPTVELEVNGEIKTVDINVTSDVNLKTNIKTIEDPLKKVLQIRGVTFDWKENYKSSAGVIAQEVEKSFPELVNGENTKSVNYNGLIGLLIETVKNQQAQIDDLNNRLSKLE